MTNEEETLLLIKGAISQLPASELQACKELADLIRRQIKSAGEPVGILAMALIGAESQLEAAK